jgi:hypothetical protein
MDSSNHFDRGQALIESILILTVTFLIISGAFGIVQVAKRVLKHGTGVQYEAN